MTVPNRLSLAKIANWTKNFIVVWGIGMAIFTTIATFIFSIARNEIADFASDFLRLDRLATGEQIARLELRLDQLGAQIDEVTGENGYLIVRIRQSYVLEPVLVGEAVTVRYLMRRTARGADCVFISATPLFRDIRDIAFPGEALTPPIQIGTQFQRIQTVYQPPDHLIPGRVEITVALRYECDGQPAFDEIPPLTFELTEALR